jgi:syntaxin 16
MFRDRTNLYISFRQSYVHHPQLFRPPPSELPEEQQGLIADTGFRDVTIEMDLLPPSWVDVSEQIDETLASIRRKVSQLDVLHRRNALPGFDDRSKDEKEIEKLTLQITSDLHGCQSLIKGLDSQLQKETSAAELKMGANMKISLATKVQEASMQFRKMQSQYLKSLRNEAFPATPLERAGSPAQFGSSQFAGSDPQLEDELDVQLSENTLQQSSMLATSEDASIRQREQEITKIAQGILELAEIFKDLQTMVIDQGTLLDRIDYNVETMYVNVKQADKELIQGAHYQKRTQKCKIILLLVLIILALIIILIVKPKRHESSSSSSASPPAENVGHEGEVSDHNGLEGSGSQVEKRLFWDRH